MSRLTIVPTFFIACLCLGCSETNLETSTKPVNAKSTELVEAKPTPVVFNVGGAPTVEFNVPDMMCEHSCTACVKDLLEKQEGVQEVKIDFKHKTAIVAVDTKKFDADKALAALVDEQFNNSTVKGEETLATATKPAK